MKKILLSSLVLTVGLLALGNAQAHDPALHTDKAEKPECGALKEMDHSKMDANDPVMMALMKKCMNHDKTEMQHVKDEMAGMDHGQHDMGNSDCMSMDGMDHSKMGGDDSEMTAMMEKCKNAKAGEMHPEKSTDAHAGHSE